MPFVPGLLTHSSFFVLISANGNAVIFTVVKPLQFRSWNFTCMCMVEELSHYM